MLLQQLEARIVLDASVNPNPEQDHNQDQDIDQQAAADAQAGGEGPDSPEPMNETLDQVFSEDSGLIIASDQGVDVQAGADDGAGNAQEDVRVLVINSGIADHEDLAAAAQDGVITVVYDGSNDTLDTLLSEIETALDGSKASSIAFATHDLGAGQFHLVGGHTVSLGTLLGDADVSAFWTSVGSMVSEGGRIDILACDLASTDSGMLLVSLLENVSGHNVAASDDPTGNASYGGDWILETDQVDAAATYFAPQGLALFDGILAAETKIDASDGQANDEFGHSVAIDGDYAIVGAYGDDDQGDCAGAAYIFHWDGSTWTQESKLKASGGGAGYEFGSSVSIDGDYAIIGAQGYFGAGEGYWCGAAYIFHRDGSAWTQQARLTASDYAYQDYFGFSVSISGDNVIVGALDNDGPEDSGAAYIFHRDGSTWTETKLKASDAAASDKFGDSVSISGDYAIVGSPNDDDLGSDSGSAYIFHWDGSAWTQQAKVKASDGAESDWFGCSVSIDGANAIVGASGNNVGTNVDQGSAYVFHLQGTTWTQVGSALTASDGAADDQFGLSVAINGDYAIVGARLDDSNRGSAYIFHWDGTAWAQHSKLRASDGAANDQFGISVAIDADYAIAGAWYDDGPEDSGSAYLYDYGSPTAKDDQFSTDENTIQSTGNLVVEDSGVLADNGHGADSDPDGDPLFVDLTAAGTETTSALGATIVWNDAGSDNKGEGGFTYAPTADHLAQWDAMVSGDSVTDTFTYVVSDGAGGTDMATVTVTVTGENDPPVAGDDTGEIDEDHAVNIDVLDNDSDPDNEHTLSVASFAQPTKGVVTQNPDGTLKFDPNGEFEDLAQGSSTSVDFTYVVQDEHGATDSATVTVTVEGVNDAPTAQDFTENGDEDTLIPVDIQGNSDDVDNGAALEFQVLGLPANGELTYNGAAVTVGTWYAVTGSVEFNPDPQWNGTTSFDYQVRDEHDALSTIETVTVTVNGVNDKPAAFAQNPDTKEDCVCKITLTGDDGDAGVDQALTYFINSLPDNGKLYATKTDAQAGTNALADGAQLTGNIVWFKSDQDNHVDTSFTFFVKDDGGGDDTSDPAMVDIDIYSVNDAPVVHMPDIKAVHDETRDDAIFNVVRNTQIFVTDADAGDNKIEVKVNSEYGTLRLREWDNVTFSGNGTTALKLVGAVKWVNEALKGMRYDPYDWFSGNAKVTVYANDRGNNGMGGALTDTEDITIKVKNGYIWNWREWWNRR